MSDRFDLAVIGGGPAGCAAAITAARRGKRVVLLERGRYPRHKVCGEFVSAESLELLRSLLSGGGEALDRAPRIGLTRVFLEGGAFEAPIDPPSASLSRYELDSSLWNAAVGAGVHARQASGIIGVTPESDGYATVGDRDQFLCDRVIFATGRSSQQPSTKRPFVGLKAHFRMDEPPDSVDLYFGKQGYCGVQPLGGGVVNVCAMLDGGAVKTASADRMSAVFALHERLQQKQWTQVTETVATAALNFGEPQPLQDGIICAGDAAGFIDPFLGDGISLALQTGALAGEMDDAEAYAAEYRERFLPVFRRAARLRKLLNAPIALQKTALLMMKWPGVAQAVVERTRAAARNVCVRRPG